MYIYRHKNGSIKIVLAICNDINSDQCNIPKGCHGIDLDVHMCFGHDLLIKFPLSFTQSIFWCDLKCRFLFGL